MRYQMKYYYTSISAAKLHFLAEHRQDIGMTYLTGAHLVECHERKRLGEHGGGKVLFGARQWDEDGGEHDLRKERDGLYTYA